MPRAPTPADEADRQKALETYGILDTPAEQGFDDLTAVAAQVCDVPIALVSLIDGERQWFKSKVGLCVSETSRDAAFCAYAIQRDEPLIIRDATLDPRTQDNPLVTGEPFIRFYAGVPLRNADGFALGTLCVIDTRPRDLSAAQLRALQTLARQAVTALERHRQSAAALRVGRAMGRSRFRVGPAVLGTFVASMAVVALAVWTSREAVVRLAQQRFEQLDEHVLSEVGRRANLPVYGLKGARGVFAASKSVERNEFAAYVASRDLPREFPGVLGFGLIRRTLRADLPAFVAAQRADDAPTFDVRPIPGTRSTADDLYVIAQAYPLERNAAAWGLDVGSEPGRRATIERAVRTGEMTISPPIRLIQAPAGRPGFVVFQPVYRNGTNARTPDERTAALEGVLFAPVVFADALAGVFEGVDGMLGFELRDVDAPTPDGAPLVAIGPSSTDARASGVLTQTSTIAIGGRRWSIRVATTPRFAAGIDWGAPWTAGLGGTALSVLLSAVIWSLGRGRARAVALADGMTVDLTAAKDLAVRTTQELKASATILRRTGEMARVGGWELDLRTQKLTWSDEVYRIHELDVGSPIDVARAVAFYADEAREAIDVAIRQAIDDGTPWDVELPLRTARGRRIYVRAQGECVREGGVAVKLWGAFQDVTQRREAQDQLRRTATHDKLTGLPNRALLLDRLQHGLSRAQRQPTRTFAVLFMDFDRFKLTNDTLGHEAGDDLLKQIAGRLRACLRAADTVAVERDDYGDEAAAGPTVGRLGGDEFVVILDDLARPGDATIVADRLLHALAEPYRILGHEVVSTASIGIVTSDPRYARPDEMLRDADIAMYEAKLAGKGRYVVFDDAMYRRVQERVETEADLRGAAERGELALAFEPILSMATAEVHGVEVLLRWNHPTRGQLGPDQFVAIAEEGNLILPIGEWVLRAACAQFAEWQRTLGDRAPGCISVNLSRKQLHTRGCPTSSPRSCGRRASRPSACTSR